MKSDIFHSKRPLPMSLYKQFIGHTSAWCSRQDVLLSQEGNEKVKREVCGVVIVNGESSTHLDKRAQSINQNATCDFRSSFTVNNEQVPETDEKFDRKMFFTSRQQNISSRPAPASKSSHLLDLIKSKTDTGETNFNRVINQSKC